jgi:hypothetical protein
VVTDDVHFPWDGVTQRLGRGTVLDVVPGSPLEEAIGADHLRPLHAVAAQPAAAGEPEEAPAEGPPQPDTASEPDPKPKARAKADTGSTTAPGDTPGGDPP